MFITNDCASFRLYWKESLVKHQKVIKYYENDCLKNFILPFMSLLTVSVVKNSHIKARIYSILLKNVPKQTLESFNTKFWHDLSLVFTKLASYLKNRGRRYLCCQKNKMIFSLAWNTIITEYGKVIILKFSQIRNTVFFDPKGWCKMTFSSVWNIIFTDYWKALVLNFSEMEIRYILDPKSWWKNDVYLVLLNFSWYSGTWKIGTVRNVYARYLNNMLY